MAEANVFVRYLADASKLVTESKRAGRATRGVGRDAKTANKSMSSFAGTTARFFAGTAVAAGMAVFVKNGIAMADTADLIKDSWQDTFGPGADDMLTSLAATRKALGLSTTEAQTLLIRFGQLSKSMGLGTDDAVIFSKKLFTMAGDVAAFNGKLDEAPRVLDAFGSALKGEFDALEGFGIILKKSDIVQRALIDTGKDSADQLTKQEEAAALMALITEQLTDETGALEKAMDSGATSTNEISAEMKDAQEATGQVAQVLRDGLNTALLGVIGFLGDLGQSIGRYLNWLNRMGETTSGVFGAIFRLASDMAETLFRVGNGAENMAARFRSALATILSPISRVRGALGGLSSRVSSIRASIGRIRIPGFATGGTVPGQPGSPQLIMAHGGEQVMTAAQQRGAGGGGGGQVFNITVNAGLANPAETAVAIVDLLRVYQRTQGSLPVGSDPFGTAP